MAARNDGNPRDVSVNHGDVAVGIGRIGKVDDQTGRLLPRLPFIPRQLGEQTCWRLHDLSTR